MKIYNYKNNRNINIYAADTVIQLEIINTQSDNYTIINKTFISFNLDKTKNKYISLNAMFFEFGDYENQFVERPIVDSKELELMREHDIVIINDSEISLSPSFLLGLI